MRFQSYWDVYKHELVQSLMDNGRLPGHACEFETSTMLHLAPERVHTEDLDNEAAALGTREKGEQLIEPVISGVAEILRKMIAGEEIDQPPVTFGPEGPRHMITGEQV